MRHSETGGFKSPLRDQKTARNFARSRTGCTRTADNPETESQCQACESLLVLGLAISLSPPLLRPGPAVSRGAELRAARGLAPGVWRRRTALSTRRGESSFGDEHEAEVVIGENLPLIAIKRGPRPIVLGLGTQVYGRFSLSDSKTALISVDWVAGLNTTARAGQHGGDHAGLP